MEHHRDLIRTPQGFHKDCKRIKLNIVLQGLRKDSIRTPQGLQEDYYMENHRDLTRTPQGFHKDCMRIILSIIFLTSQILSIFFLLISCILQLTVLPENNENHMTCCF
jgi:hypothetical protein